MVGNLKVTQSLVLPLNILLPERISHTLIHAALQLAFQVLGMDHRSRIHGRRHLEHPDIAGVRVDLHFGHLDGMDLGLKGRPLTGFRVEGAFGSFFFPM